MRCEVCGAPFQATGDEIKCERCRSHKTFSAVPRSIAPAPRISRSPSIPASAVETQDTAIRPSKPPVRKADDAHRSGRSGAVRRPHSSEQTHFREGLPLPEEAKHQETLPSRVVLEGKYRLLNELGRGSMGTVFQAEDTVLKRKVAVKFLLPELADSSECAVRFKREAIAMAAIRNENVAQIFAYGEDNGTPYFVMEYLDGETVEHFIDSHNRRGFFIPVDDVVDVMIQTLYGLSAIHKAGAVHRDIKPGNIMLTVDPVRSVIMDFGLVRDVKVEDDMRTLAGTPAYIAPELVEGKPGADRSKLADIYSLGTTFYELLTGSIPFGGDTWVEILQKHIAEMPTYPSVRRPGLPEIFDEIVLRAMSKDPHERYQNCEEFLDDLFDVQEMELPHERRPSMAPSTTGRKSTGTPVRRSSRSRISSNPKRAFRSTPTGSRGRLLVADGDPSFRLLVHESAKASVPGCRIHSASDGNIAFDLLKSIRPHVFIVDLSLPEINGLEMVATLSGDPEFENMTTIVVSETGGNRDAALLKSMGVNYFLTKPIDSEALTDILRPLLERPMSISAPPGSVF